MPVYNELEEHGHEVRPLLAKGETLRALTLAEPAYGSTGRHDPSLAETAAGQRIQRSAAATGDAIRRSRIPRWLLAIVGVVAAVFSWGPSWSGPGKLVRRLFGGQVVEGEPGSLAREVQAHLAPYGEAGYLAVTDRQLYLLAAAPILAKRAVADDPPLWTARREVVSLARRTPRLFSRARIELTFTDGSRIVLSQSPLHSGGWHAAAVVSALST
jgi:hypothetical protein